MEEVGVLFFPFERIKEALDTNKRVIFEHYVDSETIFLLGRKSKLIHPVALGKWRKIAYLLSILVAESKIFSNGSVKMMFTAGKNRHLAEFLKENDSIEVEFLIPSYIRYLPFLYVIATVAHAIKDEKLQKETKKEITYVYASFAMDEGGDEHLASFLIKNAREIDELHEKIVKSYSKNLYILAGSEFEEVMAEVGKLLNYIRVLAYNLWKKKMRKNNILSFLLTYVKEYEEIMREFNSFILYNEIKTLARLLKRNEEIIIVGSNLLEKGMRDILL